MKNTNLQQINSILLKRHCLLSLDSEERKDKAEYYAAFLYANFAIAVDKPHLLTEEIVKEIQNVFKIKIPKSFYKNPQDIKHFSVGELIIEQLVSYFLVESGFEVYDRVKIFDKDLPCYEKGSELVVRHFYILNKDEADEKLKDIVKSYASYTRPFSNDETEEFLVLYDLGYFNNEPLKCRDNYFILLDKDITLAKNLDKKDLVKLSISLFGDGIAFLPDEKINMLQQAAEYVFDCPLSKKQAKFFNKIVSYGKQKSTSATNEASPYRLAKQKIDEGKVLKAAKIFAANGSLLLRNLNYLLSRCNKNEIELILDLLPSKNLIALFQIYQSIVRDNNKQRVFSFVNQKKVRTHKETLQEYCFRQSRLSEDVKEIVKNKILDLIKATLLSCPSLGKIYISPEFEKIALPTNTSTSGKGIDVLPTGSRLPFKADYIRTFIYWKDAFDMDASLIICKDNGLCEVLNFSNFAMKCRIDYNDALGFSGDCRNDTGSEFFDLDIKALRKQGVRYIFQMVNGFFDTFANVDLQVGYQNKENLETVAWDPKNIEMQFHIKGDSREAACFAFDLISEEVIIINSMTESMNRIISTNSIQAYEKYLNKHFLDINMKSILSFRGEMVDDPNDADIIFDKEYVPHEGQEVVRPYETEKLVSFLN